MNQMIASTTVPDLNDLSYPCYIQPIYKNSPTVVYIPSLGIYRSTTPLMLAEKTNAIKIIPELEKINDCVIEGYILPDKAKFIAFDCMLVEEFVNMKCSITYEDRLMKVRDIVMDRIGNPTEVLDIPTDIVTNPKQIVEIYKTYLTSGYLGITIRDMRSNYVFGYSKNGEMSELRNDRKK